MKNLKNSKTKKIIQKSFIELLEKLTIDNLTVVNICKKAKIERKTFYLHYNDKYDLAEKIIEEYLENLEEICRRPTLTFYDGTLLWFEYIEKNRKGFEKFLNGTMAFYFKYKFEKLLEIMLGEEIKNEKDIVNDEIKSMNRDLMLVFLVSFVSGIVYAFVNGKLQRTTKEITIDIIKLLEPYIYV